MSKDLINEEQNHPSYTCGNCGQKLQVCAELRKAHDEGELIDIYCAGCRYITQVKNKCFLRTVGGKDWYKFSAAEALGVSPDLAELAFNTPEQAESLLLP